MKTALHENEAVAKPAAEQLTELLSKDELRMKTTCETTR